MPLFFAAFSIQPFLAAALLARDSGLVPVRRPCTKPDGSGMMFHSFPRAGSIPLAKYFFNPSGLWIGLIWTCQSALNVDPLSAPKNDPPFVLSWPGAA